jgi:hypothetical protein
MSEIAQLVIAVCSAPSIALLYWAYRNPDRLERPSGKLVIGGIILAYLAAALLPLLEGQRFFSALFVAYPLLYATLFKRPIRALAGLLPMGLRLFAAAFLLPFLGELFVVLDYRGPILAHFLHYAGFYLGFAAAVAYLYPRWKFSFAQVFSIGGMWGVLVEQQFAGPKMLLSALRGDPDALLSFFFFAFFIFLVYGLYLVGPHLLFSEDVQGGPDAGWRQVILAYLLVVVVPLAAWGLWSLGLQWIGVDLAVVL